MVQKRKSGYNTHDSFVVDDDEQNDSPAPQTKRSKKNSKPAGITATSFTTALPAPKRDADNNLYWEISKARRVTVSDFKGKKMIAIREYYEKDGDWLPGKKGISMSLEQYAGLVSVLPGVENELRRSGIQDVPRPNYEAIDGGESGLKQEDEEATEDSEEGNTSGRANHEATSDEEE